jgi:Flp pilus assembly protein TadD
VAVTLSVRRLLILLLALVAAGCSGGPGPALREARRDLERAERLLEKNRFKEARRVVSAVRSRHPRDWQVASSAFVFWLQAGRLDEASRVGREMVVQRDRLVEPHPLSHGEWSRIVTRVATAVMEDGDEAGSAELMELALQLDSSNPDAANGVAWLLAEQGRDLDRALTLAKRAVRLRPDAGYIVDTLGWVYFRQKRYEEAERWLIRAVRLSPGSAELRRHLAEAHLARGNLPSAYVEARKAVLLDPSEREGRALRARIQKLYNPPGPL